MLDLDTIFDPDAVDARNAARFGLATASAPTWAQQTAALLATIQNDGLRTMLRDDFEERAAVCEFDGKLTREEAEKIAFEEIRGILTPWRRETR